MMDSKRRLPSHPDSTLPSSHLESTLPNSHLVSTLPNSHLESTLPNSHLESTLANRRWVGTLPKSRWLNTLPISRPGSTLPNRRWVSTQPNRRWVSTRPNRRWVSTLPNRHWVSTLPNRCWVSTQPDSRPGSTQLKNSGGAPYARLANGLMWWGGRPAPKPHGLASVKTLTCRFGARMMRREAQCAKTDNVHENSSAACTCASPHYHSTGLWHVFVAHIGDAPSTPGCSVCTSNAHLWHALGSCAYPQACICTFASWLCTCCQAHADDIHAHARAHPAHLARMPSPRVHPRQVPPPSGRTRIRCGPGSRCPAWTGRGGLGDGMQVWGCGGRFRFSGQTYEVQVQHDSMSN